MYLKYKDVYQNNLYFNQAAGNARWSIDDGFAEYPETITLQPGSELKPYSVFEVVKPIEVQAGKITPWFNQPGGGIQ